VCSILLSLAQLLAGYLVGEGGVGQHQPGMRRLVARGQKRSERVHEHLIALVLVGLSRREVHGLDAEFSTVTHDVEWPGRPDLNLDVSCDELAIGVLTRQARGDDRRQSLDRRLQLIIAMCIVRKAFQSQCGLWHRISLSLESDVVRLYRNTHYLSIKKSPEFLQMIFSMSFINFRNF